MFKTHWFPVTCDTCTCAAAADACAGVACGKNSACVGGKCACKSGYIQAKTGTDCVRCTGGSLYTDGVCKCGAAEICTGDRTQCQKSAVGTHWWDTSCDYCKCAKDACAGVTCPERATCNGGKCVCQAGTTLSRATGNCVSCPAGTQMDNSGDCRCPASQGCSGSSACTTSTLSSTGQVVHYFGADCSTCKCSVPQDPCDSMTCPTNAECTIDPTESTPGCGCRSGYESRDGRSCVKQFSCGSGQYVQSGQRCKPCPEGTFAEGVSSQRTACTRCPSGSTSVVGSMSYADCKEVSKCPAGTRDEEGLCYCSKGEICIGSDECLRAQASPPLSAQQTHVYRAPSNLNAAMQLADNMFEGDMPLPRARILDRFPNIALSQTYIEPAASSRAAGIVNDRWRDYRWTDGVIPYEFHSSMRDSTAQQLVLRAMQQYHDNTCIRFVPRKSEKAYVRIRGDKEGCWSNVGRIGTMQELNLQAGSRTTGTCRQEGIVVHELGHAAGLCASLSAATTATAAATATAAVAATVCVCYFSTGSFYCFAAPALSI